MKGGCVWPTRTVCFVLNTDPAPGCSLCQQPAPFVQVRRTAARELEVVQSLHHINLVFPESFRINGKLHLVSEFMHRTLLHDIELMPQRLWSLTCSWCKLSIVCTRTR